MWYHKELHNNYLIYNAASTGFKGFSHKLKTFLSVLEEKQVEYQSVFAPNGRKSQTCLSKYFACKLRNPMNLATSQMMRKGMHFSNAKANFSQ